MIRLLLCLPLLAFAALATALPELSRQPEQPAWQQWGSAEMSRFGFRLYRATLWVAGERLERSPTALQLDYRRDIDSATLVASSIDEMRRLGSREEQLQRWQSELARVLPDVKKGDRVVAVFRPGTAINAVAGSVVTFYHAGRQTGEIADGEFGPAFFAIWLDPATRAPEVRSALLRRPQG
ncbi:chalcone isomerase family protein [Rhodocyclus tenuis]|uniref:Chalcone isomerase domain-containing protein n=1 Tax=Rhodocyclus tenuis TaxID=1066 RepID=A0A840GKZ0_RHOTE|nr:chalcone isomerase family protein [Rhodocyclus tenuis]MBB4248829.1 hypothetical protein [Rhodocyclus tenuis]MBK1680785.1 hypothetical protein [Rhodocyclus tenuis]